ncbi:MAG: TIGR01777 family protein [Bacteroidetes bacterium]|nr:MAG: TIGR01777 family protein [Bacteroidota bacterium]
MQSRIIILGGSGLIGKRLARQLKHNGSDVIIFSRNPEKYSKLNPEYIHIKWDVGNHESWKDYIIDAFGIINLAGVSIGGKRWTKKYKQEILDSRLTSTNALVEEIIKSGSPPRVLINASGVDYYGNTGDIKVDESSPAGDGFLASVCRRWEEAAFKALPKTRVVAARMGLVLAPDALAIKRLLLPFKLFIGGPLGNGRQWFPWIHIDDVVEMCKWIIENPDINGPINFVSPYQVTMKQFAKTLGYTMHRPSILPLPEFLLRIAVGESAGMIVNSKRVVPGVALDNNFHFKYEVLEKALSNIIS